VSRKVCVVQLHSLFPVMEVFLDTVMDSDMRLMAEYLNSH